MYLVALLFCAFLILSVLMTNWPAKGYHYLLLKKLGQDLGVEPQRYGMTFSSVFSEINTIYKGRDLRIRFLEGSIDSLKSGSGLEIRIRYPAGVIMEFYHMGLGKREWGDFKRFLTGESPIDAQWFILTNDQGLAGKFWEEHRLRQFLTHNPQLEQILVNNEEIVLKLRRYHSSVIVIGLIEELIGVLG